MASRIDLELSIKGEVNPAGGLDHTAMVHAMQGLQAEINQRIRYFIAEHPLAESCRLFVSDVVAEHPQPVHELSVHPRLGAKSHVRVDVLQNEPVAAGV